MNRKIAQRFERARRYLERIRDDMMVQNPIQGMADAAELSYQAQALWSEFKALNKSKQGDDSRILDKTRQIGL
jgi:hypothetical protein